MDLNYELFAGRVSQTFTVSLGNGSIEMVLMEARRAPTRPAIDGIRTDPFALYFKYAGEKFPPQGMYTFGIADMEDVEMFVVPIRKEQDGIVYEAIFN